MAKKTPFFSHDMNARHDPKMTAMRGVYGVQGYGIFWILVEMMGEADGYKLSMKGKYDFDSYAMQANSERNTVVTFVNDCINEFELFQSDGYYFWSPSLLRRMEYRDQKSEKARESVSKRWKVNEGSTNVQRSKNDGNTINKTKQNLKHSPEFDEFWDVYPRKIAKTDAWKAWQKRMKEGISPELLKICAANYADHCKGKEAEFIKHPASFLNGDRYTDYAKSEPKKVVSIMTYEERRRFDEEHRYEGPAPGYEHLGRGADFTG